MNFLDIVPKHIREIRPYDAGKPIEELERELGLTVAQLGLNENPFGPSPKALEAMRRHLTGVDRYPEDTGYYLRQRLSKHFNFSMDEIIVGCGSCEILAMIYQALVTPDTEVLTSEGSFVVYYWLAQVHNARLVLAPLRNFEFDLPRLIESITPKIRLILIANPNNPTGTIVRRREFDEFMRRVPDHVLVVVDEAYFEYVDDAEYPESLKYVREGKQLLITRTFSKAYGLAGLRIGYAIAGRQVIETLHKVRMAYNVSNLAQVAALAAWDDREYVERCVKANRAELAFLYRELAARGVKCVPSFTNFILMDVGRPGKEVSSALLRQGIMVRPMGAWGFPSMIRVSIGTHEQNEAFLKVFDEAR
jgi:histidinol-phosphate aminotransferase